MRGYAWLRMAVRYNGHMALAPYGNNGYGGILYIYHISLKYLPENFRNSGGDLTFDDDWCLLSASIACGSVCPCLVRCFFSLRMWDFSRFRKRL